MNRRSFIKSAALAAVAVPVVGLPEAKAVAAPVPAKPALYRVQWELITSKGEFRTTDLDKALTMARSLFCEWLEGRYPYSSDDIPSIRMTKNGKPVKWLWNWTGSS